MNRFLFSGGKSPVVAILCLVLYFCQPVTASAANRAPSISGSPATTAYVGKRTRSSQQRRTPTATSSRSRSPGNLAGPRSAASTGSLSGYSSFVPDRDVFEHRHQRQRWHRDEVAACVFDQGGAGDVDRVTGDVVMGAPDTECRRHPAQQPGRVPDPLRQGVRPVRLFSVRSAVRASRRPRSRTWPRPGGISQSRPSRVREFKATTPRNSARSCFDVCTGTAGSIRRRRARSRADTLTSS